MVNKSFNSRTETSGCRGMVRVEDAGSWVPRSAALTWRNSRRVPEDPLAARRPVVHSNSGERGAGRHNNRDH
jgi:hypothetical protein